MIYIDRGRIIVPPELLDRAKIATIQLIEMYREGRFREQRIQFQPELWMAFRPYLEQVFYRKCAFCETEVEHSDIEHFRPKTQATSLGRNVAPDHYFWLAYDWNNLMLICQDCNRMKRNEFPVNGQRDAPGTSWDDLQETELLVNPCRRNPEDFFLFDTKLGIIGARQLPPGVLERYGGSHPGEVTIKILNLNRAYLIEQRRLHATHLQQLWIAYTTSASEDTHLKELLQQATLDRAPYAALSRQIIGELSHDFLEPQLDAQTRARSNVKATSTQIETPAYEAVEIRALHIQNFRSIEDLTLDCPKPWKVILGENATGKSTILQAIACALMGQDYVNEHYRNGRAWLTLKGGHHMKKGFVELQLSRGDPIRMEFDPSSIHFASDRRTIPTFLRAYGTVRLPASRRRQHASVVQSVSNLFDPHYPLTNAIKWLASLKEKEQKPALIAIRDMLLLQPDEQVDFRRKRVAVPLHGDRFTSDELSTGYQDMFNVVADIISGFPLGYSDMQAAFGIVLMDEIGVHLHPRWKMKIVSSLKQTFPNIQFIVTTHDPLCLRGLDEDEVVVMIRDGEGVTARTHFGKSPRYMRVDQLLTSNYFGLESTVDPTLDAEFREYYALLLQPQLSAAESYRRQQLRAKLDTVSSHGVTRRDQLLCEILDAQLARHLQAIPSVLDENTKRRVWERWQQLQGEV